LETELEGRALPGLKITGEKDWEGDTRREGEGGLITKGGGNGKDFLTIRGEKKLGRGTIWSRLPGVSSSYAGKPACSLAY